MVLVLCLSVRHVAFCHKTRQSYFNCQSFSFAGIIKRKPRLLGTRLSLNTEWDIGWIAVIRKIGLRRLMPMKFQIIIRKESHADFRNCKQSLTFVTSNPLHLRQKFVLVIQCLNNSTLLNCKTSKNKDVKNNYSN